MTQDAKCLLVHYFKTLFQVNGLHWTDDHTTEVESIVDLIVEATVSHAQMLAREGE